MRWYLVHTKPGQERCALQNLEQQGYQCYLPTRFSEKFRQGEPTIADESLFPRYLFICLGQGDSARSWVPIRSTEGVSRVVSFGAEPVRVGDGLINFLQAREMSMQRGAERLFKAGEQSSLTDGAFAGIEGVYQVADGELRIMALIEFLSSQSPCVSLQPVRAKGARVCL